MTCLSNRSVVVGSGSLFTVNEAMFCHLFVCRTLTLTVALQGTPTVHIISFIYCQTKAQNTPKIYKAASSTTIKNNEGKS